MGTPTQTDRAPLLRRRESWRALWDLLLSEQPDVDEVPAGPTLLECIHGEDSNRTAELIAAQAELSRGQ
jgi:hypothetical protein